jgi:DNA topoisomerase-1
VPKNLAIVESPAKAKTIMKILGRDFLVKSSKGHVRDLPQSRLGVNIEKDFEPQYTVVADRKKIVAELKAAAADCEAVYLCPDPDREGEAIAWHLQEVLRDPKHPVTFHRVRYNEITPRAVREAFAHPGQIEMHRVEAQQARRVLDRIVGYKVSPLLWSRIRRGLSAGRVQSVALKLVCDRERAIQAFRPEAFWILGAAARKRVAPLDLFRLRLARIGGKKADVRDEAEARRVREDLDGSALRVLGVRVREVARRAAPPFITSTLQQAASTRFGFSPSRTMSLAQRLYEGVDLGSGPAGLITYMRTDSFNVAQEARDACSDYIGRTFGAEYLPDKPNAYRSRAGAQEAHEAIRPTDVTRTPESLAGAVDEAERKLYGLIWQRFVASQMSPARFEQRMAEVAAVRPGRPDDAYVLTASSSDVLFPGYMRVWGVEAPATPREEDRREAEDEPQKLPPLAAGEDLDCVEWLSERKETQPPPRFSEASLVRELERNGVGRPSTYAATLGTLQERRYVVREKRVLTPTELGLRVNDLLQESLSELFDPAFTARMEEALDAVERGEVEWHAMLADFYRRFSVWMGAARGPAADAGAVGKLLEALRGVQEWRPPTKRGKRTYSDEKFVESIRSQLEEGSKPISERQLQALASMARRYREQAPDLAGVLTLLGMETETQAGEGEPDEAMRRKLALLEKVPLGESTAEFVASLRQRVEGGRALTPRQSAALDSVLLRHGGHIPDFETVRAELGMKPPERDEESGRWLQALASVSEWHAPVQRGERTFDDRVFRDSLASQFAGRGYLSPRQKSALRRMLYRYRSQIPESERPPESRPSARRSDHGANSEP